MKWGRRKSSSSSSSSSSVSRPSLISSWLSKLKKMGANDPEPEPARDKPNVNVNVNVNVKGKGRSIWSSMSSSVKGGGVRGGGHFFGGEVQEDEAFWRLSFGEDGKKSRGVLRSVLYDSDDELEGPPSSFRSSRSNAARFSGKDESQKFRDLVFSIKVKELPEEMGKLKREKEMEIKTPRKGSVKELKFRSMHRRALEERLSKLERDLEEAEETQLTKTVQKDVLEVEPAKPVLTAEGGKWESTGSDSRKHCYGSPMNPRDYNLKTIEEDHVPAADNFHENGEDSAQKFSPQWQKMKERKIEELKIKTEKHRKSYYISRELQGRAKQCNKVRVYSPRTPTKVEICKIKALEDLKRGRLKTKKRAKETTALESLAVVKCSFDPEKDFRDSMMEMILEERIGKPEELEELLACYLTLNDDKYHDLIIKVFRQVWLDLNGTCFHTEMHGEDC